MADHELEPTCADDGGPASSGRRQFIQKVGAGAAIAWTIPMITSSPAVAQQGSGPLGPWVMVGGDGSGQTVTSEDDGATTPINASPIASGEVHAVAYSPLGDKWIAVGRDLATGGVVILTSTDDGASWTSDAVRPTGRLLGIATDGVGNWVAVGESVVTFPGEPHLLYSSDNGVTWSDASITPTTSINTLHGIATDGTTWIAGGQNDSTEGIITISTDGGATWSDPIVLSAGGHVFDVATDGAGMWVAVGENYSGGGGNDAVYWTATGGVIAAPGDWTENSLGTGTGFIVGVASDHFGTFVMVGRGDDPSGGAKTWTLDGGGLTAGTFPGVVALALHEVATDQAGVWIAVGYDDGGPMRYYISTDNGLNWSVNASPGAGILLGIATDVVA